MAEDADVGFVSGGYIVNGPFESKVKTVAVIGGGFGVVENGLVRDADIKNILKDIGCFSGADGE